MEKLLRSTPATGDVLSVLLSAEGPVWGLLVAKESNRPTGSVYPILARLESAAWVEATWEEGDGRRGARRRLYTLTPDGAEAAEAVILQRANKTADRRVRLTPTWIAS